MQDIYAGVISSNPSNLTAFNGKLYFTAQEPTHGVELWSTTDVPVPTIVQDINVGTPGGSPSGLTVSGGKLYFAATDGTAHGSELWSTDGTTTAMVKDINVGAGSGSPSALKDIGGKLVFTANNGLTGSEPWVSDGTAAGTQLIQDVNLFGSGPGSFINVNGTLYFIASDPVHGSELWKSDGTTAGTTMVMDLNPGTASGIAPYGTSFPLINVNGTLYFLGSTSTGTDSALYKLDNTGTPVLVKNVIAGYVDWLINFTAVDNTLYFVNYDAGNYYLWRSDGTAAGTVAVTDPSGVQVKDNQNSTFINVNGTLYFQGGSNSWTINGAELYKIDANGNQVMVQDLAPGNYVGSTPSNLTNVGGTLYFTATVGGVTGLYSSDGTTITPVTNTPGVTAFSYLTDVGGTLFFNGTAAATTAQSCTRSMPPASCWLRTLSAALPVVRLPTSIMQTALCSSPRLMLQQPARRFGPIPTAGGATLLKDINPGTGSSFFTTNSFTYLNGMTLLQGYKRYERR